MTTTPTGPDPREHDGGDPDAGIPRSVEDERRILGEMMTAPAFARDAVRALRLSDFRDRRHAFIFEAIRAKLPFNSIDHHSIITYLDIPGRLRPAGGRDYINSLRRAMTDASGSPTHRTAPDADADAHR